MWSVPSFFPRNWQKQQQKSLKQLSPSHQLTTSFVDTGHWKLKHVGSKKAFKKKFKKCELIGTRPILQKTFHHIFVQNMLKHWLERLAFKLIGKIAVSIFELFSGVPTWPNLAGLKRPFSPYFNPLTLPGYPLSAVFSKFSKTDIKKKGAGF